MGAFLRLNLIKVWRGDMMDALLAYGGSIKSLGETDDAWKFAGWLVVHDTHDVSNLRDRFTKSTEYDIEDGDSRPIYYNHGFDGTIKKARIGRASLTVKDSGVWLEGEIQKRDDYLSEHAAKIAGNIDKFGLSSGCPAHLVERKSVGDGHDVLKWPIAEASITPVPAEPMTGCFSVKSLMEAMDPEGESGVKTLVELLADSDDALIQDALKALPAVDKYAVSNAARLAISNVADRANYIITSLIDTDYRTWDEEKKDYVTVSKEERLKAIGQALSDFANIAYSLAVSMSDSMENFTTKSLGSLTENPHAGLTFEAESAQVLAANAGYLKRVQSLAELRCVKSERRWSADAYSDLLVVANSLVTTGEEIKTLAEAHSPHSEGIARARVEAVLAEARCVLAESI